MATRVWGAVKAVGGIIQMAVGAAGGAETSWTGIGAVMGGAAVFPCADVASAGITKLLTGKSTGTSTEAGISKRLQMADVSQETSNTAAGFLDAGVSVALNGGGV